MFTVDPSQQTTTLQAVAALHKCCEMFGSVSALTLMCPAAVEDRTLKAVSDLKLFNFLKHFTQLNKQQSK